VSKGMSNGIRDELEKTREYYKDFGITVDQNFCFTHKKSSVASQVVFKSCCTCLDFVDT